MQNLKGLPRNSIVLLLSMFADSAGQLFISPEIIEDVAMHPLAPVILPLSRYLGRGVVGGHMDSLERVGAEVADLALEVLAGAAPATLCRAQPAETLTGSIGGSCNVLASTKADCRPGSEIRFRPPTAWEQYRWQILLVALALLVQSLTDRRTVL